MKRLSSLGIALLATALWAGTPRAHAHGDAGGGSSDTGHSDTSTHGGTSNSGTSNSGTSNSGGHAGHEGGASQGAQNHGHSNESRGVVSPAASGAQHGVHSPTWRDSRHREISNFSPTPGITFRAFGSSDPSGKSHFPAGFRPAERSHAEWAAESRARDPRRDIVFHGYHYRFCNGAWGLINAECALPGGFCPPTAPDESTNETDFAGADSSGDVGLPEVLGIAVQTKLAHRGYYHGRIDGIIGPTTRDAISAYQRDNGLRVTGYVNTDLIEALRL